MKDVKSTTAFVQALNESMESGSLMCQLYSAELSKLLMNMTNIPKVQYIKKAAVCLGKQPDSDVCMGLKRQDSADRIWDLGGSRRISIHLAGQHDRKQETAKCCSSK